MFFHSRLKENLLCAVFLFSKIIFFLSEQQGCCLTSSTNSEWSLGWKPDPLLGICYTVKTALNLTACLPSAGRGLHTLYIQSAVSTDLCRAGSDTTFTSCWAPQGAAPRSARWEMWVAALRCVVSLLMVHVDSAALILPCEVAWEFWAPAKSLHINNSWILIFSPFF